MKMKLAAVQYGLSGLQSQQAFWDGLTARISEAAERCADLLLFPEYLTAHLLCLEPEMTHDEACRFLDGFTTAYVDFFRSSSRRWNMALLGGTHICREGDGYVNKAFLFFPDGRIETQNKLHLTPEERNNWALLEGDSLRVLDTQWAKISILTCYDIEFPELARAAAARGAELILCPSYTDTLHGFHRVRNCCQARAVENQLFVALSGMVGALPEGRPQVDQGYGESGLFAPCDLPFPEDGIVCKGEVNREMIVYGEADFAKLLVNRNQGDVSPFFDRRPELYERESGRKQEIGRNDH